MEPGASAKVRCGAGGGNRLRLHSAAGGMPVIGAGATLHFHQCDVESYSSPADAVRQTVNALELFGNENRARLSMTGGTLLFGWNVRRPPNTHAHALCACTPEKVALRVIGDHCRVRRDGTWFTCVRWLGCVQYRLHPLGGAHAWGDVRTTAGSRTDALSSHW